MKTPSISTLLFILFLTFSCSWAADPVDNFLECLTEEFPDYSSISSLVYTPTNSSYSAVLQYSIQNYRFETESTPKPLVIITPNEESQVPPIIYCAKKSDIQIRIRSGGHDFEGLSYVSQVPFVLIDFINFSEITVDAEQKTAWVGVGATIGQLYYWIAQKSPTLGFPAGACPTIGIGGHIGGGGYGSLHRKYGLAADNAIDVKIVDVKGRILNRELMGEDLFWAIRGGQGASFGVLLAWKVQLVDVPEIVTVFSVTKTLEQNATQLINRWQYVAPSIDQDLFTLVRVARVNVDQDGSKMTMSASFTSLFLGGIDRLLLLMQENFPELGLVREDCQEISWIQSVLYFQGFPLDSPEFLLNRTQPFLSYFKGKSDYVQTPIPVDGFEGIWNFFYEPEGANGDIVLIPYGGKMAEIPESAIPFPHRAGILYKILYAAYWSEDQTQDADKILSWQKRLYNYTGLYVSNSPRRAYVNYRDLDIGVNNNEGRTSYKQASVWGKKYFVKNFKRLVKVKTMVDPKNFFVYEQSIPSLGGWTGKEDM
ncbi:Tetrahydrocannabinolic acid synthase [Sesamum alatum]|uniref:Tetrahydrocannabinolic acid synthase n=1 Tax=Sesamum alatum TaxID=300844 RepID=A0AAE1Z2N1_9LAMI|nr:Tetrahydrocannabinolic acid synthase [Sesamum alatum]